MNGFQTVNIWVGSTWLFLFFCLFNDIKNEWVILTINWTLNSSETCGLVVKADNSSLGSNLHYGDHFFQAPFIWIKA